MLERSSASESSAGAAQGLLLLRVRRSRRAQPALRPRRRGPDAARVAADTLRAAAGRAGSAAARPAQRLGLRGRGIAATTRRHSRAELLPAPARCRAAARRAGVDVRRCGRLGPGERACRRQSPPPTRRWRRPSPQGPFTVVGRPCGDASDATLGERDWQRQLSERLAGGPLESRPNIRCATRRVRCCSWTARCACSCSVVARSSRRRIGWRWPRAAA